MTTTSHLSLPYLESGQAQKHVTHNEALRMLDALVMLSVEDRDLSAPPPAPAEGARYIVNAPGSGAFAGKDNQIAHFIDGGWLFYPPQIGWLCFVADESLLLVYDGSEWTEAIDELQNLTRLGVGTSADVNNPFAAKLNNALWTARTAGEGGDGDLRYKLNKEAPGNTLSMLLQTGWSGRAEIGLTGDDDLHVKVSDDGAAWRDSLVVAAATGKVSFPHGVTGLREKLMAARTYYVRTDGSDANDGLTDSAGGAFLTIQKAVEVVFGTLDLGGCDVTIQLADGSYPAGVDQRSPQVGAGLVTIQGNAANPENVVLTATAPASTAGIRAENGAVLNLKDFELRTVTAGFGLLAKAGAFISYANLRIGPTAYHQVRADDLGRIECKGNYAIAGGGMAHWCTVGGGLIRCQARTITLVGTPAFSSGFANSQIAGMMIVNGNTFSGGATGKHYQIDTNAVVYVAGAGADYLPGNAAGTAISGAQYG